MANENKDPSSEKGPKRNQREGNDVGGQEQPPSGVRPGEGRDADDEDAGGVGKSL